MKKQKISLVLAFLMIGCLCATSFLFGEIGIRKIEASIKKEEKNLEESLLNQVKKATTSDGLTSDQLGWSSAISGDTAIVGANQATIGGNQSQGAAYIFERNAGGANNWGQTKKLIASDGTEFNNFGTSVAISGDLAVVGMPFGTSGAAYIFERNAGGANNWGQVKKLLGGFDLGDDFGISVSVFGDTVVVGCRGDSFTATGQGSAYIFERNAGGANNWGQVKLLLASDAGGNDLFGSSVSISNDLLIVGAPFDTINGLLFQGSAYIFERNFGGANNWGEVKKLLYTDPQALVLDYFGSSVSISGDTAVVGIPRGVVDASGLVKGAAFIFQQNLGGANNWGAVKKIKASDPAVEDFFGTSVGISGDMIIVGSLRKEVGANTDQGASYIFERNAGGANNWGETQKIFGADGAAFDSLGKSVAISGNTVIAGSPGSDIDGNNNKGATYFFQNLTPTAATASVSGRVTDSLGSPVPRVQILLTDANGNIRTARTNPFGYYRFQEIAVGQTYIIEAKAKTLQFQNNPRVLFINEDLAEIDFAAN